MSPVTELPHPIKFKKVWLGGYSVSFDVCCCCCGCPLVFKLIPPTVYPFRHPPPDGDYLEQN
eukprot:8880668-Pyramimonas_sp.AAC.1